MQLEMRDIDMELLPAGMERRKANQSSWDNKYVTHCLLHRKETVNLITTKKPNGFIEHRVQILQTKRPSCTFQTSDMLHYNDTS